MAAEPGSHRRPLRCRFGLHHYVKKVPANHGEPYLQCTRCHKENFPGDSMIPPSMGSGMG
jgi:hypothetical protein